MAMLILLSRLKYKIIIFCALFFVLSSASAQEQKAVVKVDSMLVNYFNRSFDSLYLGRKSTIDTSLENFSHFDALSKSYQNIASLSNNGAAHRTMIFSPEFYNGFDTKQNVFDAYIKNNDDVRYLNPLIPFSELNYMSGSKKEQHLGVSFNRQIAKRLFIGMEFSLIDSPGPYKNSTAKDSRVYFTSRYNVKNKRYAVIANFFHNKVLVLENGGIADDADFENNTETDRRLIAINLTDAQNMVKQSGVSLEQYFILSAPRIKLPDSIQPEPVKKFRLGRLTHQLEYMRNQMVYSEKSPLVDFYQPYDVVLDSTNTYDSIFQMTFKNRFQWSNLGYKLHNNDMPLYIFGGVELVNGFHSDSLYRRDIWQVNPYGGVQISLFRSFYIDGNVKLISGNYSNGDLSFNGGVKQYLGTEDRNLGNLFFRFKFMNQSASWMYERFYSNHFRWENDFTASKMVSFKAGYYVKGVTLGANIHFIDKHIYLNSDARPVQTSGSTKLLHLYSDFHVKPGKFDIQGSLNYQKSDNDSIIRVPELSTKIRVSFTQNLFKGAATMEPGITFSWFSKYYADAYMPALRAFHIQNEKEIGAFPFADVYLALKVKRARIFVKYANIIGLTGDYSYYTTPHYPMYDPRFFLGVSWRFYK